jgi:uncharacterized protein (TIGR03546 family)
MKYFSKLKDYILRFIKKGLSPHEIALSLAVGIFVAFIPVFGTHTVIAIFLAYILRVNTLIVLLGTQISNPLSFPFQIFISAEVGNLILNGALLEIKFSKEINYLSHYLWPIIVGSLILGIGLSVASYLLTKVILKKRRARHDTL